MYHILIREALARAGHVGAADPRHIEGYIRLEHPTLDGLTPDQFQAEVVFSLRCVLQDGVEAAERLAQSFGL